MSDPFRENPFNLLKSPIRKPDEVYTPSSSPRKNSPSKAAMKYSPAVSFRRRESMQLLNNSTMARNFVQAAEESPFREQTTARKLFTNKESPTKSRPISTIIDNQSDDDVLSHYSGSVFNSPKKHTLDDLSKSINSNRTTLETPKPIFSAETFAAANNENLKKYDDPFSEIPMLTPKSTNIQIPPTQQSPHSRVSSAESASTLQTSQASLTKKETYASSGFSDDQSTLGRKTINEEYELSSDEENFDDDSHRNSFDKHLFEQIPQDYQPRRNNYHKTQKVFRSRSGHLVLDTPVPELLHDLLPITGDDEFDYMKYSAVTSDPDNFVEDGFSLRAIEYERETEIVICITMYNEDEVALTRTLHSVFKNIAYLAKRKRSPTWGPDAWKKVVVCIVADGRNKVSEGVLEVLGAMGVYQEGIAKSYVNKKEVKAHIFEYTAQVSVDEQLKVVGDSEALTPVQVIFCLKEKNAKKINSHRWLFNAICPILNPNVCILLDVGTRPNESAVYNLWKAFDLDSNVAGAAGEIVTMKGKYWSKLLNPLVASQNFEYKMSNILDKPCESVFGYISVLPGALSAYRYSALQNHEDGTGPLYSYFLGESSDSSISTNMFSANMYLAEDRILAWELVSKKGAQWVLKYCKDAKGETDVPETLSEFVLQRRRWLNGAFFAALNAQRKFYQIWKTDHSMIRKIFFHIEFIYQGLTLLFSFFSISNFYITFYYLAGSLITIAGTGGKVFFEIMNYLCICTLLAMLVISMGNRPTGAPKLFLICVILLTVCGLYAMISGFYFLALSIKSHSTGDAGGLSFASICVSLASTYGLYTLVSVLYLDPWHIITSSAQYFLMLPSYTCLLQIYAFCNTHDVTWGTKGDTIAMSDLGSAIIETDESGQQYIKTGVMEQRDINSMYNETLFKLKERRKKPISMRDDNEGSKSLISSEDYYRDVRSRVVLFWVITNVILVMTITQIWKADSITDNRYLAFILWSVFGFSVFRFCGSFGFLIHLCLRKLVVAKHKWDLRRSDDVPEMKQIPN